MTTVIRTDRSRIETGQRCLRARWWEYHADGGAAGGDARAVGAGSPLGIVPVKKALPLAVGGSVHEGLAELLRGGQAAALALTSRALEDRAVAVALADFAQFHHALDIAAERGGGGDAGGEASASPALAAPSPVDFAGEFGAAVYDELTRVRTETRNAVDDYLFAEQSALVEALVRAWSRRRLTALLAEFEVLEVEREGEWALAEWNEAPIISRPSLDLNQRQTVDWGRREIRFMSRPDALLRSRADNSLTLLSFKTAAGWDHRKARDAGRDMQGLSEGMEVERRLGEWWAGLHYEDANEPHPEFPYNDVPKAMVDYLCSLPSPPRILAVRYEYLLKGERWKDDDLARRLGDSYARRQRSHLIYGYCNAGMAAGDEQWNWSYSYLKPDGSGEKGKLYYKTWRPRAVWEGVPGGVARWIDWLDDSAMAASGDTGAELGIKSDAQATGYTEEHPLEAALLPPVTIFRNDDDLRDLVEQMEAGERRVAEAAARVHAAADEGERRSALNREFPQSRRACSYPTDCAYVPLCYGGADIRREPVASGLYKIRKANHPMETEGTGYDKGR